MTCAHVLGLIDAGPFADYPRAHLDAAWQHARQCATCGPALELANALTSGLRALPQAAPPPALTATVLARIARTEQTTSARAAEASPGTRDWPVWVTTTGGLAAGLAIVLSIPHTIDITSPRLGGFTAGLVAMPDTTAGVLVLAAGLALYAAGLFAPVSGGRRPETPS
jgi:hypothetical protein